MTAAHADPRPAVLVVEDGHEYITNLQRFLSEDFEFHRAGDGRDALEMLARRRFDVVFLDMRFDRSDVLIGDLDALVDRFAGDGARARRFLEDNQGTYILAALRQAGHDQPVLFSHDFDAAPRRFQNLRRRYGALHYGPLRYLVDSAGPAEIRAALWELVGGVQGG